MLLMFQWVRSRIAAIVADAMKRWGQVDIVVNNAAHQSSFHAIEEIEDAEWDRTFAVNIHAMFYIVKAAMPFMAKGGSIINTASINSDKPSPDLLAYATTKGAIQNFTNIIHTGAGRGVHLHNIGVAVFGDGDTVGANTAGRGGFFAVAIRPDAVEAARDDARRGGLADTANAGEQERMRNPPTRKRVGEGAHQHFLTDEVSEGRRAVFAGKDAVHGKP